MISGIQHFAFCRRQWALIHLEQQWTENYKTMDGNFMHRQAHNGAFHEKRKDIIISRGMPVFSRIMGVSGICDIVEFHADESGTLIRTFGGKYTPLPIEYKRGKPKDHDADILQVAAQAMCLEEMLDCTITQGALYYGEIKHRVNIQITEGIKQNVKDMFDEMHQYYERGYTPKAKKKKACYVCSLKDLCLPELEKTGNVENNISIVFLTPSGSFLARVEGKTKGNVLLRKKQYEVAADEQESLKIARNTIVGKVYNGRWVIERTIRDHSLQTDADKLKIVSERLRDKIPDIRISNNKDQLRGIEGELASQYFSVFDELILQQKEDFYFHERNRRPPLDRVNALLSFVYTLLTSMMAASLETVGLDPCVGFLHGDRPGRYSLALDMMEELRPALADRFVLRLINKRMVGKTDFIEKEDGAILLTDDARKRVLDEWQKRKQEQIIHPYLKEKIQWGMVPYMQAMFLARYLRGDIDAYPPFLWK